MQALDEQEGKNLTLVEMFDIAAKHYASRAVTEERKWFCKHCAAHWGGNCVGSLEDTICFTPRALPEPVIDLEVVGGNTIWKNYQSIYNIFNEKFYKDKISFINFIRDNLGTDAHWDEDDKSLHIRGKFTTGHIVGLFYGYLRVMYPFAYGK